MLPLIPWGYLGVLLIFLSLGTRLLLIPEARGSTFLAVVTPSIFSKALISAGLSFWTFVYVFYSNFPCCLPDHNVDSTTKAPKNFTKLRTRRHVEQCMVRSFRTIPDLTISIILRNKNMAHRGSHDKISACDWLDTLHRGSKWQEVL